MNKLLKYLLITFVFYLLFFGLPLVVSTISYFAYSAFEQINENIFMAIDSVLLLVAAAVALYKVPVEGLGGKLTVALGIYPMLVIYCIAHITTLNTLPADIIANTFSEIMLSAYWLLIITKVYYTAVKKLFPLQLTLISVIAGIVIPISLLFSLYVEGSGFELTSFDIITAVLTTVFLYAVLQSYRITGTILPVGLFIATLLVEGELGSVYFLSYISLFLLSLPLITYGLIDKRTRTNKT